MTILWANGFGDRLFYDESNERQYNPVSGKGHHRQDIVYGRSGIEIVQGQLSGLYFKREVNA